MLEQHRAQYTLIICPIGNCLTMAIKNTFFGTDAKIEFKLINTREGRNQVFHKSTHTQMVLLEVNLAIMDTLRQHSVNNFNNCRFGSRSILWNVD